MSDNTTESEQRKDSFVEQAFSDWFVENMYGNDPIYAKEKAEEAFKFAYDLANDSGKDSASGVRVNALVSDNRRWKDVDEALPGKSTRVLCCLRNPIMTSASRVVTSYEPYTDQDEDWFMDKFSHWVELPPTPE